MTKFLSLFCLFFLVFALSACGHSTPASPSPAADSSGVSVSPVSEDEDICIGPSCTCEAE